MLVKLIQKVLIELTEYELLLMKVKESKQSVNSALSVTLGTALLGPNQEIN